MFFVKTCSHEDIYSGEPLTVRFLTKAQLQGTNELWVGYDLSRCALTTAQVSASLVHFIIVDCNNSARSDRQDLPRVIRGEGHLEMLIVRVR